MHIEIEKVKHHKGNTQEGYTASVRCGSKSVNIVYDSIKKNLIIHRWYKLTEDECNAVSDTATRYFETLAA